MSLSLRVGVARLIVVCLLTVVGSLGAGVARADRPSTESIEPAKVAVEQPAEAAAEAAEKGVKKKGTPLPKGVQLAADIVYASPEGHPLLLDLYRPLSIDGPLPVVVFVHGGGWLNGSKKSGKRALGLVPHGFAVASINYRLTDTAQWPGQIDDCYAAVRWLRRNAGKYNLDPQKIGCWGTSAGAHLAALLGTRTYPQSEKVSSRVQAVCDWFGPSELLTMPPNMVGNGRTAADVAKSNGAKLLGKTVRKAPELARDASSLDQVSADDPPFLIMHGDADPGVPLAQSEKLHQRLTAAGVDSTLVVLAGAGHGGAEFNSDESTQQVLRFFTRTLKDK